MPIPPKLLTIGPEGCRYSLKTCDIFLEDQQLRLLTKTHAAVCIGGPCLIAACHEDIRSSTPSPSFNFSYVTKAMAIDGTTFM